MYLPACAECPAVRLCPFELRQGVLQSDRGGGAGDPLLVAEGPFSKQRHRHLHLGAVRALDQDGVDLDLAFWGLGWWGRRGCGDTVPLIILILLLLLIIIIIIIIVIMDHVSPGTRVGLVG